MRQTRAHWAASMNPVQLFMKALIVAVSLYIDTVSFALAETVVVSNERSGDLIFICLLYTSPSPRDRQKSRMPSSA